MKLKEFLRFALSGLKLRNNETQDFKVLNNLQDK